MPTATTKSLLFVWPGWTVLRLELVSWTRFGPEPPGGTLTAAVPLLVTATLTYTSRNGLLLMVTLSAKSVMLILTLPEVGATRKFGVRIRHSFFPFSARFPR